MIIKNASDSVKSNKQRYSFFTPLELKTLNHCAVDMPLLNPFHKNAIMRHQSQLGRFSRTLIGMPVYHRIPTAKLKIPGKLFLKSNPELLLHSSYSF